MNKNDVVIILALLGVMLGGVGAWAGFNARSQVEKDRVDSEARDESNLDFVDELRERTERLEKADRAGPGAGGAATEAAVGSSEEIQQLRADLAAANQRISRVTESEQQLREKVRELIERLGAVERVSNGMTQALKEVQAEVRKLPRDSSNDTDLRERPEPPK